MQATIRQLRNTALNLGRLLPPLTRREHERYQEILELSPALLMHHPRATLTFSMLAIALRTTSTTLRRYFADLDDLIGAILFAELLRLTEAFAKVPRGEGRAAECRKLYFDFTRTGSWSHNPIHLLMIRDRRDLPPDLRDPLDAMRHALGVTMAGAHAEELLAMFELPYLSLEEVDAATAAIIQVRAAAQARTEAPDETAPPSPPAMLPAPEPEPAAEPQAAMALLSDEELFTGLETPPAPEPEDPCENQDPWAKAPSANDKFFSLFGIAPRSRSPPE